MFDQEKIKTVLPHRDPFLFCDRILEATPEKTVAEVDYGAERYFYKGHFPSYPVTPGVILVESMAQCGGAGYRLGSGDVEKKLFLFAKLMEVRFINQVVPGMTVRYEIETVKATGKRLQQKGRGIIVGKVDKRGNPLVAVEAEWFCLVVPEEALTGSTAQ
ncbi:MAG: 3-hydroxyacyl-ACP dehydratase FabZ family protein [Kiritimatiellia bacterium]